MERMTAVLSWVAQTNLRRPGHGRVPRRITYPLATARFSSEPSITLWRPPGNVCAQRARQCAGWAPQAGEARCSRCDLNPDPIRYLDPKPKPKPKPEPTDVGPGVCEQGPRSAPHHASRDVVQGTRLLHAVGGAARSECAGATLPVGGREERRERDRLQIGTAAKSKRRPLGGRVRVGVGVGRSWVCVGCKGWLERSVPPPWPRGRCPARLVPTKHADQRPLPDHRAGGAGLAARHAARTDRHVAASGGGPGLHDVLEGEDLLPLLQLRLLGRARLRHALHGHACDASW